MKKLIQGLIVVLGLIAFVLFGWVGIVVSAAALYFMEEA